MTGDPEQPEMPAELVIAEEAGVRVF